MHPFSILTLGIFVAGYTTARWDLVTRLYELAIFAWDHGVVVCLGRAAIPTRHWANDRTAIFTPTDPNSQGIRIPIVLLFPLGSSDQPSCLEGGSIGTSGRRIRESVGVFIY